MDAYQHLNCSDAEMKAICSGQSLLVEKWLPGLIVRPSLLPQV